MVPSGIVRSVASAAGYEMRTGARPSGEVMSRYAYTLRGLIGVLGTYIICAKMHMRE